MRNLPPFDPTRGPRRTVTIWGPCFKLSCDPVNRDFHIDVAPEYSPTTLATVLAQARRWGLEPMDPDIDCDADTLRDGTIRIWLARTRMASGQHTFTQMRRRRFGRVFGPRRMRGDPPTGAAPALLALAIVVANQGLDPLAAAMEVMV